MPNIASSRRFWTGKGVHREVPDVSVDQFLARDKVMMNVAYQTGRNGVQILASDGKQKWSPCYDLVILNLPQYDTRGRMNLAS